MSKVHTNNNACLTIFGLFLGGGDFTETISNVVAMGIVGAIVGEKGIPAHWTAGFHDQVRTYIDGVPSLSIRDVTERFVRLARSRLD